MTSDPERYILSMQWFLPQRGLYSCSTWKDPHPFGTLLKCFGKQRYDKNWMKTDPNWGKELMPVEIPDAFDYAVEPMYYAPNDVHLMAQAVEESLYDNKEARDGQVHKTLLRSTRVLNGQESLFQDPDLYGPGSYPELNVQPLFFVNMFDYANGLCTYKQCFHWTLFAQNGESLLKQIVGLYPHVSLAVPGWNYIQHGDCLLYTSDAADE